MRSRRGRRSWLLQLGEQQAGFGAALGERLDAARGVDRRRAQEPRQLSGGVGIEAGVGAAGQAGDLAETAFDHRIPTLLEHERPYTQEGELARLGGEVVDLLLKGVADEH